MQILSPIAGQFWRSENPSDVHSERLVKDGDQVVPRLPVCLVEFGGMYNEVQANCTGKIVRALVQDGDFVVEKQPIFEVE